MRLTDHSSENELFYLPLNVVKLGVELKMMAQERREMAKKQQHGYQMM